MESVTCMWVHLNLKCRPGWTSSKEGGQVLHNHICAEYCAL
jgi:hypothetical protein